MTDDGKSKVSRLLDKIKEVTPQNNNKNIRQPSEQRKPLTETPSKPLQDNVRTPAREIKNVETGTSSQGDNPPPINPKKD